MIQKTSETEMKNRITLPPRKNSKGKPITAETLNKSEAVACFIILSELEGKGFFARKRPFKREGKKVISICPYTTKTTMKRFTSYEIGKWTEIGDYLILGSSETNFKLAFEQAGFSEEFARGLERAQREM